MHKIGDSWQYWEELAKAEHYFNALYCRCTGKRPYTKETWGVIRYGILWSCIETTDDARLFQECIRRTVRKFPNVAAEVVADAAHVLDDRAFNDWCEGVIFVSASKNLTNKRRLKGSKH